MLNRGSKLGHYEIMEPLGAGGMGEVYRARDTRLGREVALKLLSEELARDPRAVERFQREARTVAALNHPNICVLHDIGEHEGRQFLVMELLEGRTLKEHIGGKALPAEEIVRLGAQLADALAAAHSKGVIHRDLKPTNVFVNESGQAKILDFGIAKLARPEDGETVTQTVSETQGLTGTLPYMAPEQVLGAKVDERADLYALGCVLYEMATGQRTFPETHTGRLTDAILHRPARPPSPGRGGRLPAELERIILQCLEKDPANRYQSARELGVDLRRDSTTTAVYPPGEVILGPPRGTPGRPERPSRPSAWVLRLGLTLGAVVAILGLLVGLNVGGWGERLSRTFGRPAARPIDSLAVLPLENLSGDPGQEYFADGMTEALIAELAKVGALRVISRTSVMQYKKTEKPLPQVARELGVAGVVEGSVLREGDQVRITVQLIDGVTDEHVWAESYERTLESILSLQREVARAVAREIHAQLTPQEQARLAGARRVNPEAHERYLRGRHALNQLGEESVREALQLFQESVEKDPGYAPAYAGLADAYTFSALWYYLPPWEAMPPARTAALKALEIDPTLAEAHVALAQVLLLYDWDWAATEKTIARALELNPNLAQAYWIRGWYLTAVGQHQELPTEARRAQQLDPLNPYMGTDIQLMLFMARDYDQVAAGCRRLLKMDTQNGLARAILALALVEKGQLQEAVAEAQAARRADDSLLTQAFYADVLARAGETRAARQALEQLVKRTEKEYVCSYEVAIAYYHLGDREGAFEWLEKAYREKANCMPFLKVDPRWDGLRDDPRFQELLLRMNLPG